MAQNLIEKPLPEPGQAPTPAELDEACERYSELQDELARAKKAAAEIEEQVTLAAECLRHLVGKFGSAHAEKSKLLHGLKYEAMCTYGQQVRIDAAKVESFRQVLIEQNKPRILTRLFEKTIRWTLRPKASEIVRADNFPEEFRALFAECEVITAKTPVLKIREK